MIYTVLLLIKICPNLRAFSLPLTWLDLVPSPSLPLKPILTLCHPLVFVDQPLVLPGSANNLRLWYYVIPYLLVRMKGNNKIKVQETEGCLYPFKKTNSLKSIILCPKNYTCKIFWWKFYLKEHKLRQRPNQNKKAKKLLMVT